MNSIELKREIHKRVDTLDDQNILEGVCRFLELNSEDEIYHVPEELKEKLKRSNDQINNGEFITHDELSSKIDKWLNG